MYNIGIDEAGRGPWFGPIIACSLTFSDIKKIDFKLLEKIKDSKKLTDKKRQFIFEEIIKLSYLDEPLVYFGIGVVDNYIIDNINIKQANKEAIRRSLVEIFRKIDKNKINSILIDGNDNYKFEDLNIEPIFIIGGDNKILEISASSIIAKVFRDKLMNTYSLLYPDLGLENHKGYGTKKHIDYLTNKSRITGFHRISFKPIKNIL